MNNKPEGVVENKTCKHVSKSIQDVTIHCELEDLTLLVLRRKETRQ